MFEAGDHPCYWYVFAYLHLRRQRLAEWLFLVPSRVVHAHCRRDLRPGQPLFYFQASMEAESQDQWTPYRLRPEELGERLVELMHDLTTDLSQSASLAAVCKAQGVYLLGTSPELRRNEALALESLRGRQGRGH